MKKILVILLFLSCSIALAQPDGWIREDVNNGHLMLCWQKGKVGVWSNARGNFLETPHKGNLLHFPETQLILDVTAKNEIRLYHYYTGGVQLLSTVEDSGQFWFGHIKASQWDLKLEATDIDPQYEEKLGEGGQLIAFDPMDDRNYDETSQLRIEFSKELILIDMVHYNTFDDTYRPIKSVLHPDRDSVDRDENVLYYPLDTKYIFSSGVFNRKTDKWVIPPKYSGINEWKGVYGAYFFSNYNNKTVYPENLIAYDFYTNINGVGIQKTNYLNYQGYAFPLDLFPIPAYKIWYDADSMYVHYLTKKGEGMYKISLYGKIYTNHFELLNPIADGCFEVTEILAPQYDWIIHSGNLDLNDCPPLAKKYYTLGYKGDSLYDINVEQSELYELKNLPDTLLEDVWISKSIELTEAEVWLTTKHKAEEHENVLIVDDTVFYRINSKSDIEGFDPVFKPVDSTNSTWPESKYKTEILSNGWVKVTSYIMQSKPEKEALFSPTTGKDSLDINGQVVYPVNDGSYLTGIFDPVKKEWIVSMQYIELVVLENSIIAVLPSTDIYGKLISVSFDRYDMEGNVKEWSLKYENLDAEAQVALIRWK